MTNYEKVLSKGIEGKEDVIRELAKFIGSEISYFASQEEDGTDIEISNFELYEIERDLRELFDRKAKGGK